MVSTWNLNESMHDSGYLLFGPPRLCVPLSPGQSQEKKLPLIAAASLKHLDVVTILLLLCSNIMEHIDIVDGRSTSYYTKFIS